MTVGSSCLTKGLGETMISSADLLAPDASAREQTRVYERLEDDGFARLLAAIAEMQRYLEALQEENRALHAALAALRSGGGIAVVIDGTPFTLRR
jgi:hypothetical protein